MDLCLLALPFASVTHAYLDRDVRFYQVTAVATSRDNDRVSLSSLCLHSLVSRLMEGQQFCSCSLSTVNQMDLTNIPTP